MEDTSVMQMPAAETIILELLKQKPGEVVTSQEIAEALYAGREDPPTSNTIQVFMGRLRKRLDATMQITTLRGKGYRLDYIASSAEVAA
jgi:DNA-binding response OmpR family regulator